MTEKITYQEFAEKDPRGVGAAFTALFSHCRETETEGKILFFKNDGTYSKQSEYMVQHDPEHIKLFELNTDRCKNSVTYFRRSISDGECSYFFYVED